MQNLILLFHGIGNPPSWVTEDERPYWIAKNEFVKCLRRASELARTSAVKITFHFDDGNSSDIEIAAPLLQEFGIRGGFFVCTGRLETRGYLNAEDLRQLRKQGFAVGSHGVRHIRWGALNEDALHDEVQEAKLRLEDAIGETISEVALPFGSYNRRVIAKALSAGFKHIHTCDPGLDGSTAFLRRRCCYKKTAPFDFDLVLARPQAKWRRLAGNLKEFWKRHRTQSLHALAGSP